MKKTEAAIGWGVRVGGSRPYLAFDFFVSKKEAEKHFSQTYHRAVKVAIVPLAYALKVGILYKDKDR